MERHAFAMEVKQGQMNTYRKKLGASSLPIWIGTELKISASGIQMR